MIINDNNNNSNNNSSNNNNNVRTQKTQIDENILSKNTTENSQNKLISIIPMSEKGKKKKIKKSKTK